jgi:hypothetical protein
MGLLSVMDTHGARADAPSGPAAAPPSPDVAAAAQALFVDGKGLSAAGQYKEACAKFEQSLRLDPAAGTRINLADCYEKRGRLASAWVAFHDAVVEAQHSHRPDWAEQAMRRASALERRVPRLTILLDDPAPGVQLVRDDAVLPPSTLGAPVPTDPGDHVISATAPGRQPWTTRIVVDEGSQVLLHVPPLLTAAESPPPGDATPIAAQPIPVRSVSFPAAAEPKSPPPSADSGRFALALPWVTTGAAAALLLGGGAVLAVRQVNIATYNDDSRCLYGSLTRDERCGTFRGAASVAETVAVVQLSAAVAAAAVSVVLFVLPSRSGRSQRASIGCALGTVFACNASF